MKITEVKYTKKFNLGNYESEEIGLVAALDEDDDHKQALRDLVADVKAAAQASPDEPATEEPPEETETEEQEETEVEETETEETEDDDTESEETDEPPKKAAKGKTGKKSFKKKPQTYDRENETHKDLFSAVLKEVAPKWKSTDASKAKGLKCSKAMDGETFLDEDGEVLPEFKKEVKRFMTGK